MAFWTTATRQFGFVATFEPQCASRALQWIQQSTGAADDYKQSSTYRAWRRVIVRSACPSSSRIVLTSTPAMTAGAVVTEVGEAEGFDLSSVNSVESSRTISHLKFRTCFLSRCSETPTG